MLCSRHSALIAIISSRNAGLTPSTRRVFVPLGPKPKVTIEKLRAGVVKAVSYIRNSKVGGTLQFIAPHSLPHEISDHSIAETIAQSSLLANYAFDKYISKPGYTPIDEIVLASVCEAYRPALREMKILCGPPLQRTMHSVTSDRRNDLCARPGQ